MVLNLILFAQQSDFTSPDKRRREQAGLLSTDAEHALVSRLLKAPVAPYAKQPFTTACVLLPMNERRREFSANS